MLSSIEYGRQKKTLKIKKLHFASPEELKQHLNLTPGSVSIFGMIHPNSSQVILIIDKQPDNTKPAHLLTKKDVEDIVEKATNIENLVEIVIAKGLSPDMAPWP